MSQNTNHLINETSPYLQQHAHNPVNWYPWGKEALETAHKENKPILLSIGYAACHWCHVMAHESFEDQETAEVMNELFINIKVDREERPDLDKIYQTAHYLLTQRSGGWPLTIFLTPNDLTPFFSGTYFPREAHYQLPAFKDVLKGIADLYQHRFDDIQKQNQSLLNILKDREPITSISQLNDQPLKKALESLDQHYDFLNGGFNGAPKFPQAPKLEFLLEQSSTMAIDTLHHMANGGIYDQLQGGFYRYSVDEKWRIPHFEKMLYDNAQLLYLYALASKQYNEPYFADIAHETANWVIDTMQSQEGGYFSSIDADSEGHEGKFYVWDKSEIKMLLTPEEYAVIEPYFGLDQPPNFETQWHLYVAQPLNITLTDAEKLLTSAKTKLLSIRNKRIPPARDEKILTSWNGLIIKAMLTAGDILQEPRFLDSAQQALTFIYQKLWSSQRLLATYKDGKAHLAAYLDDYAFLLDALLTSLQVRWNTEHLLFAMNLADTLLKHFSDANGGFFFTANDHEKLLYRPKTMMDEATPSGNGTAVRALLTLGYLLGETRYLNAAEKTLQSAWPALLHYPAEHCSLLLGLNYFMNPPPIIILRGPISEMKDWENEIKASSTNWIFTISNTEAKLPESLDEKKYRGKNCAYICRGMQCSAVIEDIEIFKNEL